MIKVVVEDFDKSPQVPELLNLLLSVDRIQDWPHTLSQYAVWEGFVRGFLNLQKPLHAFLGHFLDVSLVTLKVLEEDADDLGLNLHDVVVKRCLQTALVDINRLVHELVVLALFLPRSWLVEKLILTVGKSLSKIIVGRDITKKLHTLAEHLTVQPDIRVHLVQVSHV